MVFKSSSQKPLVSLCRLEELDALEKTVDVPIPPNVVWDNTENITLGGEGAIYYEQYTIPGQILAL